MMHVKRQVLSHSKVIYAPQHGAPYPQIVIVIANVPCYQISSILFPSELPRPRLQGDMSDSTSNPSSEKNENVVQSTLLQQLSVAASRANTPFCCAGRVPIGKHSVFERIKENVADRQSVSSPVVIRWDRADGKNISKLTLPPQSYAEKSDDQQALIGLLDDCSPASFGRGGEDVLDESYRKAAKLDSDRFSTNFNPYDVGIIGAIAQTLLPDIAIPAAEGDGGRTLVDNLGVVAELYKLNVRPPVLSPKVKPFADEFSAGILCSVG